MPIGNATLSSKGPFEVAPFPTKSFSLFSLIGEFTGPKTLSQLSRVSRDARKACSFDSRLKQIRELIQHPKEINKIRKGGGNLLSQAIKSGDTEYIAMLICRGADLKRVDLNGIDLNGVDLSGVRLSRKQVIDIIRTAEEQGVTPNLREVDLNGIELNGIELSGADLSGVRLSRKQVVDVINTSKEQGVTPNLKGVNLALVNLNDIDLSGVNLSSADLSGVRLSRKQVIDVINISKEQGVTPNLKGVNLALVNLDDIDLSGVNLSSADLSGVRLSRKQVVDIINTAKEQGVTPNLKGGNLAWVDLNGIDLSAANLSSADLSRVRLSRKQVMDIIYTAKEQGVTPNLEGVNLKGVHFSLEELQSLPSNQHILYGPINSRKLRT